MSELLTAAKGLAEIYPVPGTKRLVALQAAIEATEKRYAECDHDDAIEDCETCNGTGDDPGNEGYGCPNCEGHGTVWASPYCPHCGMPLEAKE